MQCTQYTVNYTAHCTLQYTVYTVHCILNTKQCSQHIAHYIVHTAWTDCLAPVLSRLVAGEQGGQATRLVLVPVAGSKTSASGRLPVQWLLGALAVAE